MDRYLNRLVGNISPAALLVSSFFWSWFDIVPFSPALFLAKGESADPSLFIVSFISGTLFLALAVSSKTIRTHVLKPKVFAAFSLICGCLGTLITFWGIHQNLSVFVAGCILVGVFQGAGILLAGSVATCEGTTNALFHLATALPLNIVSVLLVIFLQPLASIVFTALLPLLTLLCFLLYISRGQNKSTLESVSTIQKKPHDDNKQQWKILGCDVSFLIMVVAVTISFGFANYYTTLTPSGESAYIGFMPVFWRAITGLVVLVGYLRFSWRPYSLLRVAMVLVAAGLILGGVASVAGIRGVSFFESPIFIGLACFDLLIWAIMIMNRYHSGTSLLMIICVVQVFDEFGFLAGTLLGLSVGPDSNLSSMYYIGLGCILLLSALLFFSSETSLKHILRKEVVFFSNPDNPSLEQSEHALSSLCEENSRRLASRYFLTARETKVLGLLLSGRSSPFIANHLHVSENTVKTHTRHIYTKLDVHNRQELLDLAFPSHKA